MTFTAIKWPSAATFKLTNFNEISTRKIHQKDERTLPNVHLFNVHFNLTTLLTKQKCLPNTHTSKEPCEQCDRIKIAKCL